MHELVKRAIDATSVASGAVTLHPSDAWPVVSDTCRIVLAARSGCADAECRAKSVSYTPEAVRHPTDWRATAPNGDAAHLCVRMHTGAATSGCSYASQRARVEHHGTAALWHLTDYGLNVAPRPLGQPLCSWFLASFRSRRTSGF